MQWRNGWHSTLTIVLFTSAFNMPNITLVQADPLHRSHESANEQRATLPDMTWLSGTWRVVDGNFNGVAIDGARALLEEVWTATSSGRMIGMFRWVDPEGVRVYELQTITAEPRGIYYRLRHFSHQLRAWESDDEIFVYRLIQFEPGRMVFENPERDQPRRFIYSSHGADGLVIRLEGVAEDGTESASELNLMRVRGS